MSLQGFFDLHIHGAPDITPRVGDDLEIAQAAARAGMAGLLFKTHWGSTVERAYLVQKVVPEIRVLGGITLNSVVGGINPAAVDMAIRLGARQVWMPTKDAAHHRQFHGQSGGLSILDAHGQVSAPVREVVDLVARAEIALGTGHLAPLEIAALARVAHDQGLKRLLITHPELDLTDLGIGAQHELAELGVWFERCWVATTHLAGNVPMERFVANIRALGVHSTILATDCGHHQLPHPVEGMSRYLQGLRDGGFTAAEIAQMGQTNPAFILGL